MVEKRSEIKIHFILFGNSPQSSSRDSENPEEDIYTITNYLVFFRRNSSN